MHALSCARFSIQRGIIAGCIQDNAPELLNSHQYDLAAFTRSDDSSYLAIMPVSFLDT